MHYRNATRSAPTLLLIPLVLTLVLLNNFAPANATQNSLAQVPQSVAETIFFDDFNDSSLNTAIWSTDSYGYSISNGILTLNSGSIDSKNLYDNNEYELELRIKIDSGQWGWWGLIGNADYYTSGMGPYVQFWEGTLQLCGWTFRGQSDCMTLSPFDATQWHSYKIVKKDNALFYIDDNFIYESSTTNDCTTFGCNIFASESIHIDYVRFADGSVSPPSVPTLYNISNSDQDGNYTANWSSVTAADTYELQEQYNGGSWNTIYTGSNTSRSLSGKADGTWCYQVRASNAAGNSGWSAVKCTVVDTRPVCYALSINVNPSGSGNVNTTPLPNCEGNKYTAGTEVKLIANANSGYSFSNWSGAVIGGANPINLTMNGDKTVTAQFVQGGDPLFGRQWWLKKINIAEAWTQTRGSDDVVIAVIDTGVDYRHIDLGNGKALTNNDRDYVNNDWDARDDQGHGTHVAGISAATANNGYGIAGVCPLCRILPVKALDADGRGTSSNVARAIRYAADEGVEVINLSLGSHQCSDDIAAAVNYAYERDVVLVAAAGNACPCAVALGLESFEVNYPAQFDRVIAVAATDQDDDRAGFSSYGPTVDISAPGVDILSTYLNGGYKELDGTSMAAPVVAGVAGLLTAKNDAHTSAQIQNIMERSARDIGSSGRDDETGWGRVDAARALVTPAISVGDASPASCSVETQKPYARSEEQSLLDLYKQVRDEVFSESPVGRSYTGLYYEYGPTLARILLTHPELLNRTAQFLRSAEDEFASLLPDSTEEITLSQELYDEGNALVQDLASAGDEEFSVKMLETWDELELGKYIDEETTVIWEEVQKTHLYLPMIRR